MVLIQADRLGGAAPGEPWLGGSQRPTSELELLVLIKDAPGPDPLDSASEERKLAQVPLLAGSFSRSGSGVGFSGGSGSGAGSSAGSGSDGACSGFSIGSTVIVREGPGSVMRVGSWPRPAS